MASPAHPPDPRARGAVKLDATSASSSSFSMRIPTDLLLALLLNKTLLASSALLVRSWLFSSHSESIHHYYDSDLQDSNLYSAVGLHSETLQTTSWAAATFCFAIAAAVQFIYFRVWQWIPAIKRVDRRRLFLLSFVMFAQLLVWLMALGRLDAIHVIVFTQYCEIWATDLAKSINGRSYGGYTILLALAISFLSSVTSLSSTPSWTSNTYDEDDLPDSLRKSRPADLASPSQLRAASTAAQASAASHSVTGVLLGHAFLFLYALLTIEKERSLLSASTDTGGRRRAGVVATVVAASFTFPLGLLGKLFGFASLPPLASISQVFTSSTDHNSFGHLPAYLALSLSFLILEPLVSTSLEPHTSTRTRVAHGWPIAVLACFGVGYVGFQIKATWGQVVIAMLVAWGQRTILKTCPEYMSRFWTDHDDNRVSQKMSQTGSDVSSAHELARSLQEIAVSTQHYVKVILANPDSRKIFQFLCLNLAFMGVQLLWGVWTNSLGLISDAIHMFFDCAAIGMGLFASVMATWKTDGTFTYGYGRVETLSGFANGIFLILISIFIVFEAIQRILEPPIMNNNFQLLIVSAMGLGVNLFGMFAMGSHHHHGHSHGHGDCPSHGRSHNMMGVYLHVMADTLGSVGVIISTLLIEKFGWTGFDPIASLFIALLIVLSVIPLVLDAGRILCLDMGADRESAVSVALEKLTSINGVIAYSSPRFWPKDAETLVGTIRIQISCLTRGQGQPEDKPKEDVLSPERITKRVEKLLMRNIPGLEVVNIQIEMQSLIPHQPSSHQQQHQHSHSHSHQHPTQQPQLLVTPKTHTNGVMTMGQLLAGSPDSVMLNDGSPVSHKR